MQKPSTGNARRSLGGKNQQASEGYWRARLRVLKGWEQPVKEAVSFKIAFEPFSL